MCSSDLECTVSVKGSGRGGRCTEYLLGLCLALGEMCSPGDLAGMGIWALACDTDGIDGTEDNAGALVSPDSLARAAGLGIDAGTFAAGNDAWGYFSALGDLVVSGPTLTNVNDYRVMLVAPG